MNIAHDHQFHPAKEGQGLRCGDPVACSCGFAVKGFQVEIAVFRGDQFFGEGVDDFALIQFFRSVKKIDRSDFVLFNISEEGFGDHYMILLKFFNDKAHQSVAKFPIGIIKSR